MDAFSPKTRGRLNYLNETRMSKVCQLAKRSHQKHYQPMSPNDVGPTQGSPELTFQGTMYTSRTVLFVWKSGINLSLSRKYGNLYFKGQGITETFECLRKHHEQIMQPLKDRGDLSKMRCYWLLRVISQIDISLFMYTLQVIITMIGDRTDLTRKGSINVSFSRSDQ